MRLALPPFYNRRPPRDISHTGQPFEVMTQPALSAQPRREHLLRPCSGARARQVKISDKARARTVDLL